MYLHITHPHSLCVHTADDNMLWLNCHNSPTKRASLNLFMPDIAMSWILLSPFLLCYMNKNYLVPVLTKLIVEMAIISEKERLVFSCHVWECKLCFKRCVKVCRMSTTSVYMCVRLNVIIVKKVSSLSLSLWTVLHEIVRIHLNFCFVATIYICERLTVLYTISSDVYW